MEIRFSLLHKNILFSLFERYKIIILRNSPFLEFINQRNVLIKILWNRSIWDGFMVLWENQITVKNLFV